MEKLVAPALRVFGNIADRWGLNDEERARILGFVEGQEPHRDTLERVSHVFAIYRAIHMLLPSRDRADGWIRAINSAPPFSGRAPIDLIVDGEFVALREYLASQVEPSFR